MLKMWMTVGLILGLGATAHAERSKKPNASDSDYWKQVWAAAENPPKPVNWMPIVSAVKTYVVKIFDKSKNYVDHAIPEKDVANPVWNVMVNPKNAECSVQTGTEGNTIILKENGRERFALGEPTSDLTARAYLYCGQALLRAGKNPAEIPLKHFVNDVTSNADLAQSVEVDPDKVEIGRNPFAGNSMALVDGRFPATYLSPMALADARRQLDLAKASGKMLTINFRHGITTSGFSPSNTPAPNAQTASADPTLIGAPEGTEASR